MSLLRLPLVGSLTNRNVKITDTLFSETDQRFENCYGQVVRNAITGKTTAYLYKRLGTTLLNTPGSGYMGMEGGIVWTGFSIGGIPIHPFINSTTIKIMSASAQIAGDLTGAATGYRGIGLSETLISGVANVVVLYVKSADSKLHGYFAAESAGSFTEITSINFPVNQTPSLSIVGDAAHMDGYMFVMDSAGNVWNSDLNSLANWTITSVIPTNSYPDGGAGVCRLGNSLVAFGRSSIEFYRNAANPSGSPLARVGDSVRRIGCVVRNADLGSRKYLTVNDEVYFIGNESDTGRLGIYKLSSIGQPAKVSTPAIDAFLNDNTVASFAGAFSMHGMSHFMLTEGSITAQPCFCIDTGMWWYMKAASTQSMWVCASGMNGSAYFSTDQLTNKGLYSSGSAPAVYQDDGSPYAAVVQTGPLDFGSSKRKVWNSLRLVGDRQSVSGNTEITWSDDDYLTFSNNRNYFNVSGSNGDYASTPDSAALDITGDIDIIVYAAATNWNVATSQQMIGKWTSAGNQKSYAFGIFSGVLGFNISLDGSASSQGMATATLVNGNGYWLRATRVSATGAVSFKVSSDVLGTPVSEIAWTQLTTTGNTSSGSIFAGTALLEVGAIDTGGVLPFAGKIYAVYVYNGIGGTLVGSFSAADFDPRQRTASSSATGEVWTINGGSNSFITSESSVDMSADDQKIWRLGSSRRRAYRITDGINRPWRMEAAELDYMEAQA